MREKIILALIIIGMVLSIVYLRKEPEQEIDVVEQESFEVPKINNFRFYDIEGKEVNLYNFAGKPVVLNIWASWCGPCQEEMPILQESFEKHGQDVQYIFLDLEDGRKETKEAAINFLVSNELANIPVYFDTDRDAMYTLAIRQIPVTYFINSDMTLNYSYLGKVKEDKLEEVVIGLKEYNGILTETN